MGGDEPAATPPRLTGAARLNYFGYSWQTAPRLRNALVFEELTLGLEWQSDPRISFVCEMEVRGAGAVSTADVVTGSGNSGIVAGNTAQGPSLAIGEIAVTVRPASWLHLRAGHLVLPFGLLPGRDKPLEYATISPSAVEENLLPGTWHEIGVYAAADLGQFTVHGAVVSGLDAAGFSSHAWIRDGHQSGTGSVHAASLAYVCRAECHIHDNLSAGLSVYYGKAGSSKSALAHNTAIDVGIAEADAEIQHGPLRLRALLLYGTLEHAESLADTRQPEPTADNSVPGRAAAGAYCEVSYDVLPHLCTGGAEETSLAHALRLFARGEYYDSVFRSMTVAPDDPRWSRHEFAAGCALQLLDAAVVKLEYRLRRLGLDSRNTENTFGVGLGVQF